MTLWDRVINFFVSWFSYPDLQWQQLLIAIGLALAFGAVWFAAYGTGILKKPWAWGVLAGSALLSVVAIAFVQIPLQYWSALGLSQLFSNEVLMRWLALTALPQILLSGLVQEGSKMVPMVIWWWRSGKSISPRMGLAIGAVAGAGFGIYEAVWVHNSIFMAGWTWELVQTGGLSALAGFWERFFVVGFHIAVSALVGYGLASGKGWQFYLIAAFMHALINYSAVIMAAGTITGVQVEIYMAVVAVVVTAAALWMRWVRTGTSEDGESGIEEIPDVNFDESPDVSSGETPGAAPGA
ncbi:hypothetical protein ACFLV2_03005 [Chloroflexota bacterium]